jgi:hypothetical protein
MRDHGIEPGVELRSGPFSEPTDGPKGPQVTLLKDVARVALIPSESQSEAKEPRSSPADDSVEFQTLAFNIDLGALGQKSHSLY